MGKRKTNCAHINHSNPGLLIPCPQCGDDWKYVQIRDTELELLINDRNEWKKIAQERLRQLGRSPRRDHGA